MIQVVESQCVVGRNDGPMMTELLKFLVNDVKSKGISCPLHLGDEVTDLLLSLDLFLEVLALQEVSQLSVVMTVGLLVELKQGLFQKKRETYENAIFCFSIIID